MAEQINTPTKTDVVNPTGSDEPTSEVVSDQQPTETKDQPSESQRKLQSDRDRAKSDNQSLQERVDALENERAVEARDKAINSFLKENSAKYKDVEPEDLEFATSPEEIKSLAVRAQAKADRIRNEALKSLTSVPDESMSAEEKQKALDNLEKEVKPGQSKFGSYLNIQRKKVK